MNEAQKCPRCNNYILGTYCCTCKKDIFEMQEDNPFKDTPFGDIFGQFFNNNKQDDK